MEVEESSYDLGWKTQQDAEANKRRKGKGRAIAGNAAASEEQRQAEAKVCRLKVPCYYSLPIAVQERRTRLLKELAARLNRDRMLRYTERELEMQRLLMGKGASRKLQGVEMVEDEKDDEGESDEDRRPKKVDEKTWKPRVYKWRVERKR